MPQNKIALSSHKDKIGLLYIYIYIYIYIYARIINKIRELGSDEQYAIESPTNTEKLEFSTYIIYLLKKKLK